MNCVRELLTNNEFALLVASGWVGAVRENRSLGMNGCASENVFTLGSELMDIPASVTDKSKQNCIFVREQPKNIYYIWLVS